MHQTRGYEAIRLGSFVQMYIGSPLILPLVAESIHDHGTSLALLSKNLTLQNYVRANEREAALGEAVHEEKPLYALSRIVNRLSGRIYMMVWTYLIV